MNQQPTCAPQAPHYAPRVGNPNYVAPGMERAQPALGNQLPLSGAAMVRFIQPEDVTNDGTVVSVATKVRALVRILPITHHHPMDHTRPLR